MAVVSSFGGGVEVVAAADGAGTAAPCTGTAEHHNVSFILHARCTVLLRVFVVGEVGKEVLGWYFPISCEAL